MTSDARGEPELGGGIESLLGECLAAIESGAEPALDAVLARHATHAARLRAEIERLRRLGMIEDGAAAPPVTEPDRLGGFRLVRRIGQGGMGLVWEAEDLALSRRVALKMVRPENLWFPGARERFRREIEAIARVQHPGIVPVYSVGEDTGVPFFTMELLDGCTLADVLRELRGKDPAALAGADLAQAIEAAAPAPPGSRAARGAIFEASWTDACVTLARQVAEALDHAHGRGLVHRDVKPSNVAIARSGRAMLFDFGLARSEEADRMTRSGSQPGSLPYMSPEQVDGTGTVDARSDVYSLGATLYEMLTLAPAYGDGTTESLQRRILVGDLARPRAIVPSIPWDVETVCLTALAREPAQRYAAADDFARDLGNLLARRPIEARRAGPMLRLLRWSQRHPRISAAVLASVPLALASLGGIAWMESLGRERESKLRGRADENARVANEERGKVLRLADVRRLSELEREADALWPALPVRAVEYERWLARAGELAGRIDVHRAGLAELEALTGAVLEESGVWRLPSTEDQWHHDTLADLIAGLERIARPESGLVDDIRGRLAFASTIEERSRSGPEAKAAWDAARRSITDRDACPVYGGMAIPPQLGLLPIGRDAASGLWEFAHLQTGEPPARAADGRLALAAGTGIVLVLLPGGGFLMGSEIDPAAPGHDPIAESHEGPVHEVELAPFFMAKHVMTQGQWERLTGSVPGRDPSDAPAPLHPVASVSRDEGRIVLERLGLELPTEAQWEYACRAGTRTIFWTGDEKESLRGAANLLDASLAEIFEPAGRPYEKWLDDGHRNTSGVDVFRANGFGLHDMTGNVFQWCKDAWGSYERPTSPGDGERLGGNPAEAVYRGSAFTSLAFFARSGNRESAARNYNTWVVGLRAARRIED